MGSDPERGDGPTVNYKTEVEVGHLHTTLTPNVAKTVNKEVFSCISSLCLSHCSLHISPLKIKLSYINHHSWLCEGVFWISN